MLALAVLAAGAAPACGKKGVPLPPLLVRPTAVEGLKVRQRGDFVILSMQPPRERTDKSQFEEEVTLRLMLVPAGAGSPEARGVHGRRGRRPAGRGSPVSWVVPSAEWPAYRVGNRLEIPIAVSSLDLPPEPAASAGSPSPGRSLAFTAEVQEGRSSRSALAKPVSLALCEPPPPPSAVEARPAPGGIDVGWNLPGTAGQRPVTLYRASAAEPFPERPYRVLAPGTRGFLDETPSEGTAWRYEVRLARGPDPERCESGSGGVASAVRADLFAPARPEGLAAAAEESLIRLFWTPGPETDIAGYIVYRSDAPEAPFRRLTPEPIPETTYADSEIRRGVRYTYVVSAVDSAQPPNESGWSESAEEFRP